MARLSLNSIPNGLFVMNSTDQRQAIVAAGRALTCSYAQHGADAVAKVLGSAEEAHKNILTAEQYKAMNERFRNDHLLYAAKMACNQTGRPAPATFEEFAKRGQEFYANKAFLAVLQGIYEEILTPILPRVYSEAVSVFADVVEVGFAETAAITVESGDIPVFQDSAWGASRSVPANRFYSKTYTLNPQPKTAEMRFKWHQLIGNNTDYGKFFANLTAGLYAKTMAMWNAAMTAATSNTALIPSGLIYNFSDLNWVSLANKVSTVNNTGVQNLIAYGGAVALAKVLPTQTTGTTNVNMDAAIATLLGRDYINAGYLGEFMKVRLMPLVDAVIPGTQFTTVDTVLPTDKIYMLAASGRRPMTIAYNSATPITIEIQPEMTASFEYIFNETIALDSVAVFSSRIGLVNI